MIGYEILQEIDQTLDQLIQNAEVYQASKKDCVSSLAKNALEKTQDDLLHYLIYLDEKFSEKKKSLSKNKKSCQFSIYYKCEHLEKIKPKTECSSFSKLVKTPKTRRPRKKTI